MFLHALRGGTQHSLVQMVLTKWLANNDWQINADQRALVTLYQDVAIDGIFDAIAIRVRAINPAIQIHIKLGQTCFSQIRDTVIVAVEVFVIRQIRSVCIARIVDGSRLDEFKARYGTTLGRAGEPACGPLRWPYSPRLNRRQRR